MKPFRKSMLSSTMLAGLLFTSFGMEATPALAADADAAPAAAPSAQPDPNQVETIIVTARKRSEDSLKVPGAISAFSSTDLAIRGIKSLNDLSAYTPGLNDDQSNAGGARSDRSFQQLVIRGMNPSTVQNPTTSIFINGVPVATSDFLQSIDDTERVEVLKGPQSAYFGRETFAGAVNVITKTPVNRWALDVSGEVATRSTFNASATINVPIIDDKLILRVGGSYDSHDGSYRNAFNPSQTLGDQETKSVHATILAKPFENLTIKAYGEAFRDDDGAPATGIYIASGAGAFNQGNCTVSGQPFFCGTLPKLISTVSPAQVTTISPTTNFANVTSAFLSNPGGILSGSDVVHHFGLRRNAYHGDINVEYAIPSAGLTLTYLGGYNHNNWSELSDLANESGAANGQYPGYTGFPFEVQSAAHDMSHEGRITTDGSKRFRALVGVSYIDAHSAQGLGVAFVGPGAVTFSGGTRAQTTGGFFSLAYDIIPQLTVNFDGRYQQDKESAFSAPGVLSGQGTSKDFLPRASVQYKFEPNAMVYFTYSKGVSPGVFNSQFGTLPAASQAELSSLGAAGQLVVKPEKVTNYEAGIKGRFFNGRATLSADLYYDKWKNQLNAVSYYFAADDPANPYNVVGSATYVPNNKSIDTYLYTDNSASTTAKGIEIEAKLIPIPHVSINLAGALNDTKYDKFICNGGCLPYSVFDASGKYLPNSSKYSATAGIEYENDFTPITDARWFARADYIYKDGVYIESSNTVKTPNAQYVNVRAGINFGTLVTIEGFVNNVFNNRSPVSGFQDVNFGNFSFAPTTVMVGLPQLITGGVRMSLHY